MEENAASPSKSAAPKVEKDDILVKLNDRVKRRDQTGCLGTVTSVRREVTASAVALTNKALIVSVQWDNGTFSYFTPGALEAVN